MFLLICANGSSATHDFLFAAIDSHSFRVQGPRAPVLGSIAVVRTTIGAPDLSVFLIDEYV